MMSKISLPEEREIRHTIPPRKVHKDFDFGLIIHDNRVCSKAECTYGKERMQRKYGKVRERSHQLENRQRI